MASDPPNNNVDEPTAGGRQEWRRHLRRSQKWLLGVVAAALTAALTGLLTTALTNTPHVIKSAVGGRSTTTTVASIPIAVHVEQLHPHDICNGANGSVYPKPLSDLQDYPRLIEQTYLNRNLDLETSDKRQNEWSAFHSGVAADFTRMTISIQGRSDAAVLITGLSFQVQRHPPVAGIHLIPPHECGAGQDVRRFAVDLDKPNPIARPVLRYPGSTTGEDGRKYVTTFPYRVSRSDPEYLELVIHTLGYDCTWSVTLHWIADGHAGSTQIRNGNEPFRLTSSRNAPAYAYHFDTNSVERDPSFDWTGKVP
jgi:hypothetical protein